MEMLSIYPSTSLDSFSRTMERCPTLSMASAMETIFSVHESPLKKTSRLTRHPFRCWTKWKWFQLVRSKRLPRKSSVNNDVAPLKAVQTKSQGMAAVSMTGKSKRTAM